MAKSYYFDANPLVCWADAQVPTAVAYDAKVAAVVNALVEGPEITAMSEVTFLEVHSKICDHWRDTGRPEHDGPWAESALGQLWGWIRDGRLVVLTAPPKLAEMAMVNVEEVTRRTSVQLRAWDAVHLFHALTWSRTLGERVTLVTADGDFAKVLRILSEVEPYVDLLDPGA